MTDSQDISIMPKPSKRNLFARCFTAGVTILFVLAAVQLFRSWAGSHNNAGGGLLNEQKAFLNMQKIVKAQQQYYKTDWDGDGKKTYAKFFVHLWTSVDKDGNPIRLNLIPQKLAFSMDRARAVDGFYYLDLHDLINLQTGELTPLNEESQWAVLAVPLTDGKNAMLHLMADTSGKIFAKSARSVNEQYVDDPVSQGWTELKSVEQLQNLSAKSK